MSGVTVNVSPKGNIRDLSDYDSFLFTLHARIYFNSINKTFRAQPPYSFTHRAVEPEGQIFLHGQQAGVVAGGQPLVVLLGAGEARPRSSSHSQARWTGKTAVHCSRLVVHGFTKTHTVTVLWIVAIPIKMAATVTG